MSHWERKEKKERINLKKMRIFWVSHQNKTMRNAWDMSEIKRSFSKLLNILVLW